jgi:hypothetical protein
MTNSNHNRKPQSPFDRTQLSEVAKKAIDERDLLTLLLAGGTVQQQEAHGQAELCNSSMLPKDTSPEDWKVLEAAGVKRIGVADDLFVNVQLPNGWSKRATGESRWSELVDNNGRVRANMFYKAASYDRSAHMSTCVRFSVKNVYGDKEFSVQACDGEVVLYSTAIIKEPGNEEPSEVKMQYRAQKDELKKEVSQWLDANFPKWKDAKACWDYTIPAALSPQPVTVDEPAPSSCPAPSKESDQPVAAKAPGEFLTIREWSIEAMGGKSWGTDFLGLTDLQPTEEELKRWCSIEKPIKDAVANLYKGLTDLEPTAKEQKLLASIGISGKGAVASFFILPARLHETHMSVMERCMTALEKLAAPCELKEPSPTLHEDIIRAAGMVADCGYWSGCGSDRVDFLPVHFYRMADYIERFTTLDAEAFLKAVPPFRKDGVGAIVDIAHWVHPNPAITNRPNAFGTLLVISKAAAGEKLTEEDMFTALNGFGDGKTMKVRDTITFTEWSDKIVGEKISNEERVE